MPQYPENAANEQTPYDLTRFKDPTTVGDDYIASGKAIRIRSAADAQRQDGTSETQWHSRAGAGDVPTFGLVGSAEEAINNAKLDAIKNILRSQNKDEAAAPDLVSSATFWQMTVERGGTAYTLPGTSTPIEIPANTRQGVSEWYGPENPEPSPSNNLSWDGGQARDITLSWSQTGNFACGTDAVWVHVIVKVPVTAVDELGDSLGELSLDWTTHDPNPWGPAKGWNGQENNQQQAYWYTHTAPKAGASSEDTGILHSNAQEAARDNFLSYFNKDASGIDLEVLKTKVSIVNEDTYLPDVTHILLKISALELDNIPSLLASSANDVRNRVGAEHTLIITANELDPNNPAPCPPDMHEIECRRWMEMVGGERMHQRVERVAKLMGRIHSKVESAKSDGLDVGSLDMSQEVDRYEQYLPKLRSALEKFGVWPMPADSELELGLSANHDLEFLILKKNVSTVLNEQALFERSSEHGFNTPGAKKLRDISARTHTLFQHTKLIDGYLKPEHGDPNPEFGNNWEMFIQRFIYPLVKIKWSTPGEESTDETLRKNDEKATPHKTRASKKKEERRRKKAGIAFKKKASKKNLSRKEMVEQINTAPEALQKGMEKIEKARKAMEKIMVTYDQILNKYGLQQIAAMAMECLLAQIPNAGIEAGDLPNPTDMVNNVRSIADSAMETAENAAAMVESFAGIKDRFGQHLPPITPSMFIPKLPVLDIKKMAMEEIEEAIKKMIIQTIIRILLEVLTQLLEACLAASSPEPGTEDMNDLVDTGNTDPHWLDDDIGLDPEAKAAVAENGPKILGDISKFLTPSQICELLKGEPGPRTLQNIRLYFEQNDIDPRLSPPQCDFFLNTNNIADFFKSLGVNVDPELCDAITLAAEELDIRGGPVCTPVPRPFPDPRTEELMDNVNSIADILSTNPLEAVEDAASGCIARIPGAPAEIPSIAHMVDQTMKVLFDAPAMTFDAELAEVFGTGREGAVDYDNPLNQLLGPDRSQTLIFVPLTYLGWFPDDLANFIETGKVIPPGGDETALKPAPAGHKFQSRAADKDASGNLYPLERHMRRIARCKQQALEIEKGGGVLMSALNGTKDSEDRVVQEPQKVEILEETIDWPHGRWEDDGTILNAGEVVTTGAVGTPNPGDGPDPVVGWPLWITINSIFNIDLENPIVISSPAMVATKYYLAPYSMIADIEAEYETITADNFGRIQRKNFDPFKEQREMLEAMSFIRTASTSTSAGVHRQANLLEHRARLGSARTADANWITDRYSLLVKGTKRMELTLLTSGPLNVRPLSQALQFYNADGQFLSNYWFQERRSAFEAQSWYQALAGTTEASPGTDISDESLRNRNTKVLDFARFVKNKYKNAFNLKYAHENPVTTHDIRIMNGINSYICGPAPMGGTSAYKAKHMSRGYHGLYLKFIRQEAERLKNLPLLQPGALDKLDFFGSYECPPGAPGKLLDIPSLLKGAKQNFHDDPCEDNLASEVVGAIVKAVIRLYCLDFSVKGIFMFSDPAIKSVITTTGGNTQLGTFKLRNDPTAAGFADLIKPLILNKMKNLRSGRGMQSTQMIPSAFYSHIAQFALAMQNGTLKELVNELRTTLNTSRSLSSGAVSLSTDQNALDSAVITIMDEQLLDIADDVERMVTNAKISTGAPIAVNPLTAPQNYLNNLPSWWVGQTISQFLDDAKAKGYDLPLLAKHGGTFALQKYIRIVDAGMVDGMPGSAPENTPTWTETSLRAFYDRTSAGWSDIMSHSSQTAIIEQDVARVRPFRDRHETFMNETVDGLSTYSDRNSHNVGCPYVGCVSTGAWQRYIQGFRLNSPSFALDVLPGAFSQEVHDLTDETKFAEYFDDWRWGLRLVWIPPSNIPEYSMYSWDARQLVPPLTSVDFGNQRHVGLNGGGKAFPFRAGNLINHYHPNEKVKQTVFEKAFFWREYANQKIGGNSTVVITGNESIYRDFGSDDNDTFYALVVPIYWKSPRGDGKKYKAKSWHRDLRLFNPYPTPGNPTGDPNHTRNTILATGLIGGDPGSAGHVGDFDVGPFANGPESGPNGRPSQSTNDRLGPFPLPSGGSMQARYEAVDWAKSYLTDNWSGAHGNSFVPIGAAGNPDDYQAMHGNTSTGENIGTGIPDQRGDHRMGWKRMKITAMPEVQGRVPYEEHEGIDDDPPTYTYSAHEPAQPAMSRAAMRAKLESLDINNPNGAGFKHANDWLFKHLTGPKFSGKAEWQNGIMAKDVNDNWWYVIQVGARTRSDRTGFYDFNGNLRQILTNNYTPPVVNVIPSEEPATIVTTEKNMHPIPLIEVETEFDKSLIYSNDWNGITAIDTLINDMVAAPEYNFLFKNCFDVNTAQQLPTMLMAVHTIENTQGFAFEGTRINLKQLLEAILFGADYRYEDQSIVESGGNAGMKACADRNATTVPDFAPGGAMAGEIAKMIIMTPLMIIKSLAEILSPNVIIARIIRTIIEKILRQALEEAKKTRAMAADVAEAAIDTLDNAANTYDEAQQGINVAVEAVMACSPTWNGKTGKLPPLPPAIKAIVDEAMDMIDTIEDFNIDEFLQSRMGMQKLQILLGPIDLFLGFGPPLGPFGFIYLLLGFLEPREKEEARRAANLSTSTGDPVEPCE